MAVKVHKGLYPPGKGYAYSKSLGGWVKAGKGETKKGTGGPAPPKYVATPYKEREYTPQESSGQYKEEAKLKQQAAANERARKKEEKAERQRAKAQGAIWAAEQVKTPGELLWAGQDKKGKRLPPGSRPLEDWGKPAKTWQDTEAELKKARAKRREQASALPYTKESKAFIRGMDPERRKELMNRKLPQPAPEPWQPNLSPMEARIPGAGLAKRFGHEIEGLFGPEGGITQSVRNAPRHSWDAWMYEREHIGPAISDFMAKQAKSAARHATPSQIYKDVDDIFSMRNPYLGPGLVKSVYDFSKPGGRGDRWSQAAGEAGWAGIMGANKAAEALTIAAQNQEWLTDVTPEQRRRNEEQIRDVLNEGRGAETARDWVVGPALSNAMEGGPMTPMAYAELTMLLAPGVGFTPLRPVVAVGRAGIKGVRMLPRGGRKAWESTVREYNRIQPVKGLVTDERGQGSVALLLGLKPKPAWRTAHADQIGMRSVTAKSKFGTMIEDKLIDKGRAFMGRRGAPLLTTEHKLATEARKSGYITQRIREWPIKRLERAAGKLDIEQTYAIRALASGVMPLDRQRFHLDQVEHSPDAFQMYSHFIHSELNEKAAQYVKEGPELRGKPTVVLRDDAPQDLKDAWDYYKQAYAKREKTLSDDIHQLSKDAIKERMQATGKLMQGGEFVTNEEWALYQLATSEKRAELVESLYRLVKAGRTTPQEVSDWMAVIDAQARGYVERETKKMRRLASVRRRQIAGSDDEAKIAEWSMELEDIENTLSQGLNPAELYDNLVKVETGPGRNMFPMIFGAGYDRISFFAALKHWSDEVVDKRLASKLDEKKFHQGRTANPTVKHKGMVIAGHTSTKAWLARVKKLMPTQEEQAYWAEWYEDFAGAFAVFGEDAEQVMRGFAASQANQAPAGGITSVLKVMDKLRKGETPTSKGIGMVAKAVSEAVQGSELEKGVAAKLSDFADALRGADTRTWMGGRPEGGAPAPADIWAARDLGYVDKKHARRLERVFGLKEGVDFVVDSPGAPSGLRYERIAEAYTDIAKHLNKIEFHGRKDWKPAQVQALGWAASQKMVGIEPEDLAFALQRNSRTVSLELTQGPLMLGGDLSPEQALAAANAMIPEIRQLIEDTPGIFFRSLSFGVSGWSQGQNGSIHAEVIGSSEQVQHLISRFARAFDQEYVQASREISGKNSRAALTIGSPAFADQGVKVAFFKRLHELAPEIPVLDDAGQRVKEGGKALKEPELSGYMPEDYVMQDGITKLPGITIRTGKRAVSPATTKAFLDRFKVAVETAEKELGIEVKYGAKNVELLIGSQYGRADRLARAGGTGGLATLDDPLEAATRKRLIEVIDSVRRGEHPEPTDARRYLQSGRRAELGVPHAVGDTLDEIIEYMGAADRPHILANKQRYGQPPRVVDVHDPADVPAWSQGHETISIGSGARAIVPGSERPPDWLYRAISEQEWTVIKNNGFMQSDGRMNLGPGEGTVTSLDDPSFYLPGKLASDSPGTYQGRIIRIRYRDEDGWTLAQDGYVKSPNQVPLTSIDMVSPLLQGERGTRLSASGREMLSLPQYRPVPYEPNRAYMGYKPPTRYRVLNEEGEVLYSMFSREEAEDVIATLKETHGEQWQYTIEEKEGIPDNRYFGAPDEEIIAPTAEELRDGVVFKVTRLDDDPRLSPERARKRQGKSSRRGMKSVRKVDKPHESHMVALGEKGSKYYEDRRYFAPGEQAHDLVRTPEGDALVHKLVEDHPELIKLLWELDPQDAILTQFPEMDTISLGTIERAKDMVRDLTWEHLREKYPDGVVTLYRGGHRTGGEEGLIPWTTNYDTALNTFAKGMPENVRVREVRIGEIEASLVAQQREVPGAWYKGFGREDEMLLWGDDTSRFLASKRKGARGHASSYQPITPTNPEVITETAFGRRPIGGIWVPESEFDGRMLGSGLSRIYISERFGTGYTVAHEFFHYLESQLSPRDMDMLKSHLGSGGEDIVMGWTTWLLTGGGPGKLDPIFKRLTQYTKDDLAQMGYSGHAAEALPRQVTDLITALHTWNDLAGGAIRIKDPTIVPHAQGVAKEPFHPGMPVSLRRKLWDFHMFGRAQNMAIRGRGPVGAMWAPGGNETKQLKGSLLKSGMFEGDVVRSALRELFKANKLEKALYTRANLIGYAERNLPNGGKTPGDVTDYAIKVEPNKQTAPELKTYWAMAADVDSGMTFPEAMAKAKREGRLIKTKDVEDVHENAVDAVLAEILSPKMVEFEGQVVDTDKVRATLMARKAAAEKIGEPFDGEVEGIIWIPKEIIDSSHIFEPPSLQKAKRSSYAPFIKGGVGLADLMNDLFRISLLLANPAYYPMNFAGNLVMNMLQQGPFALYNLPRAATMSLRMSSDRALFVDNLMGEGWIGAAELKSQLLSRPSMGLTNVANMLVDRVPRRAAWLHEAMRAGYRTPDELETLIAAAERGESAAVEDIEMITRYALEEMVDFNNLTPFERDFLTRIVFVYPWLKGSTLYTMRFPLNHPVQTAAFAYLYERQQSMANNEVGERPQYLDLFFPFANVERYGEEYPYGFNLRQLFTMSTTYDIFNAMYGYTRGDLASGPLTEYLQPLYSLALSTATGYDPFLDKKVERGLWPLISGLGASFTTQSPGWQNISKVLQSEEERRMHAEEGRLYPRNRMDDILRVVLGSLAPGPVNPKTAGKRAREGTAQSPETKTVEWVEETEELTGVKVPIKITAAKAAEYRYNEIQSDIRKEEGTSDLTPWQLTEAKMRVFIELNPEFKKDENRMLADIRNTNEEDLDEWDDEFRKELGWDELNEYENEVEDYKEPLVAPGSK